MEPRYPSISSPVHVGAADVRTVRMPRAQLITRMVSGEQTGGAYSLFEVLVAPGGGEGPHVQHREDECLYVLEGRFELVVEGSTVEVGPGSLIYVPKGNLHAFENVGKTAGRLLVSQTPGGAYEGFVEKVGEPIADGSIRSEEEPPDDAERIADAGTWYGVEIVLPFP